MVKNRKSNSTVSSEKRRKPTKNEKIERMQKKRRNSREAQESAMMCKSRSVTWAMDAGRTTILRRKFKLDSIVLQKL